MLFYVLRISFFCAKVCISIHTNSLGNEDMNNNNFDYRWLPDSNTAALNKYELDQEKLFKAAEIEQDNLDMKIEELVISELEADSATAIEAIGTEATLDSINHPNKKLKEALIEAIYCKGSNSQDVSDRELGCIFRELVTNYIAGDVEELI